MFAPSLAASCVLLMLQKALQRWQAVHSVMNSMGRWGFGKLGLAYPHTQLMRNEGKSDKNLERDRPTDRQGSPPAHVTSATHASACQGSFPPQLPGDPLSPFYWSQNYPPKLRQRDNSYQRHTPNQPKTTSIWGVNYSPKQNSDITDWKASLFGKWNNI